MHEENIATTKVLKLLLSPNNLSVTSVKIIYGWGGGATIKCHSSLPGWTITTEKIENLN